MKKLVFAAAVLAALSLGACSGAKDSDATKSEESAIMHKIENCTNADSLSVYVGEAKAYAEKLVKEGKVDEAKKYLDKITPVVDMYAPSFSSSITAVKNVIDKIPAGTTDAAAALEAAQDSAQATLSDTVAGAVDAVKAAGAQAVEDAKQKTADFAGKAVDKTSDAVNKAAEKTADKVNDAKDALKDALK